MYLAIVIFLLILLLFQFTYGFTPEKFLNPTQISYYDFYPKYNSNSSICFIAGVHGNEPAGTRMLEDLLNRKYFHDVAVRYGIRIRVIPAVNYWGLKYGKRYQPNLLHPDINRNFIGEGAEPVSQQIIKLVRDFDIVVDFHEGWGFHLVNPESVGSTISPGSTNISESIAKESVNEINKSITEPSKKFIVLYKRSCEIPQTLSCFREVQQKHYLLVETSGQKDIQPLEIRKKQVFTVINETIKFAISKNIKR